jgi:sporadic carbohydrate cluster 2OG-Fe(II) oxygenase
MPVVNSFDSDVDTQLADEFLHQGYVIREAEDRDALDEMRRFIARCAAEHLPAPPAAPDGEMLDRFHELLPAAKVNPVRISIYNRMNGEPWFRPTYFQVARRLLESLVGNELAMQTRVNLSIQMPYDESSTLGIHVDTFSGESPFQVVEWIPLVDVHDTKSMFLLPPEANRQIFPRFRRIMEQGGAEQLFREVEDQLLWLRVPYGHVLVFSPNLFHGNVVNRTAETRWSLNCRITGLFTPYGNSREKGLGSFYLPITPRIVTRIGMNYRPPEGLDG